jgi:hypothetical protein
MTIVVKTGRVISTANGIQMGAVTHNHGQVIISASFRPINKRAKLLVKFKLT